MRFCLFLASLSLALTAHAASKPWPQFRGPNGQGISEDGKPPVHFGADSNLLWKTETPAGISAPVVWGNHLFLTGLVGKDLVTLAYDARTGKELWRKPAPSAKIERVHSFSSPAASTPCTDGKLLYVYFGSYGALAYDFSGKEIWNAPLPTPSSSYGTATSPILAGGLLILQRDGMSTNSEVLALNPATGARVWSTPRSVSGESYSTPMVWKNSGREDLVLLGRGKLAAYSLKDGSQNWWVKGWGFSAISTPVVGEGVLFAGGAGTGDPTDPPDPDFNWPALTKKYDTAHAGKLALGDIPEKELFVFRKDIPPETPGNSMSIRGLLAWFVDTNKDKIITKEEWDASDAYMKDKQNSDRIAAIRAGGSGDISETHVAWDTAKGVQELTSPLYYQGLLFWVRDGGMLTVVEPKTGKRILDRERLGTVGQFVSSPVAANGYIYTASEPGTVVVLKAGPKLEIAAANKLGESIKANPAIVGRTLFIRSANHLWAFAGK